jgi:hypothetical protein
LLTPYVSSRPADTPKDHKVVDEILYIAIENTVCIGRFILRPVVFYHPVGMQDVRPDLASPADVQLRILDGLKFLPLSF